MSRNKKPRRPYRPRQIAVNTLEIALHHAAKPPKEDRAEVLRILHQAAKALREGVATHTQWSIISGHVAVGEAIERQRVVRGLTEHLASADAALQSIYNRAMATGTWKPTALHYYELDAVQTFVNLHAFQVNQLSRKEYLAAINAAEKETIAQGHTATMVPDLERLAA